jgi:hypothetical protein
VADCPGRRAQRGLRRRTDRGATLTRMHHLTIAAERITLLGGAAKSLITEQTMPLGALKWRKQYMPSQVLSLAYQERLLLS